MPDEVYRPAVSAFYTSLAALQTSQDVIARNEIDRFVELVPEEPAGWANLGLLLLRQQEDDQAVERLTRAAALAPDSPAVVRLLALAESRRGNLEASISHWRRAYELDPGDPATAFALGQELERQGGAEHEAEAQRTLEAVLARTENLAVRLDSARLAAKRGDADGLARAIRPLHELARTWPPDVEERWRTVAQTQDPRAAAAPIAFLRNVLLQVPAYRLAYTEVNVARTSGEPIVRFLRLENPSPHPAPADTELAFTITRADRAPSDAAWVSAVSLNGEGLPVLLSATSNEVHLPDASTLAFPSGADGQGPSPHGILTADLNYDFRTDLVMAGSSGLRFFRQTDAGAFENVTASTQIPEDLLGSSQYGVWSADVDTDGDLDVVVAPRDGAARVLRNNTDGSFAVQSPFGALSRVRGFAWADLDGEGVPDAAFLDAGGRLRVFQNLRGGAFEELPVPEGLAPLAAISAAELTGDSLFDIVGLTTSGGILLLSVQDDVLKVSEIAGAQAGDTLEAGNAGLLVADLDNNGSRDLVAGSSSASRVFLGTDNRFTPLQAPLAFRAFDAADMDGDGRLELLGLSAGAPAAAVSRGSRTYHWQTIRPRAATATGDQRINSFGVGGEVELRTGLHVQKLLITSPIVHAGLGEASEAEVARITWPNGVLQSEFGLKADSTVAASQRLKGSCPWLFSWDGREFRFVTDLIWRSPLGLRINAQETADVLMTEDRVKIGGRQLAPIDGRYDLLITAELWETHFFDHVSLLAIDHPVGTEVFVDERFAVPAPSLAPVVTGPLQDVIAARDHRGRDVLEIVRARDDRHLDVGDRGTYQGVAHDHFVEVELPDSVPPSGDLWLVAQGWVHPTDSSVNLALSQGAHARPRDLSLHVADRSGRFRQVRSGLGFPAGKDKTILLSLAGLFPESGPRRLRLATNLEIFWDRVAWAAGRPDATVQSRRLTLSNADLRFRGFSVTDRPSPSIPERPRYVLGGTAPRWRDLEGYHTRFGDVRELLHAVDDRYVIMNAGDEMRLGFPEAPPPSPGWVRDFILVADGWVKDGDFNTTASRTVLPLPTHASGHYDSATGRLDDDPVYRRHREDFEKYHTRYVSPEDIRDALRAQRDPERD